MKILVTGAAGFIGSNFVRHVLEEEPASRILSLDKLTYAGNLENLEGLPEDRHDFVRADVCHADRIESILHEFSPNHVVHFAAESHVDRSIEGAAAFLETNVRGTHVLLEAVKDTDVRRFVHISTDEVYGSLNDEGMFTPETSLDPSSPYSASKAGADLLASAYRHTFGVPVLTVRCSNNYGPFQFPEKLIPLMILNALDDKELPLYGDGSNVRDWIYVEDFCRGVLQVLKNGSPGRLYHFGGDCELTNLEVVRKILDRLQKPESLIQFVEDRPGHDYRYAMDFEDTRDELGWEPNVDFDTGLDRTVRWYREHGGWVDRVRSGEYQDYYEKHYDRRDHWIRTVRSDSEDPS